MNAPASSRRTRITTAVVGTGVAAVIAVTAFGVAQSGAGAEGDPSAAPTDTASTDVATPSASPTESAAPTETTVPTPGATVSTPITSDAPIRTDLTAEVTAMKAVTVKTSAPGEIGGPGVRFTIKVVNTTDAPVSLADTVVNATSGADRDPAYLIDSQSKPFATTVPAHRSITGVYVFTIPTADRDTVTVTLDTSTNNPVVAFTGKAPR